MKNNEIYQILLAILKMTGFLPSCICQSPMSTVYFYSVLCGSQTHGSDRGGTCSGVQRTTEQCWAHSRGLGRPDPKARWGQRAPSCVRPTLWLQRHCRPKLLCCHGHLSYVCKLLSQAQFGRHLFLYWSVSGMGWEICQPGGEGHAASCGSLPPPQPPPKAPTPGRVLCHSPCRGRVGFSSLNLKLTSVKDIYSNLKPCSTIWIMCMEQHFLKEIIFVLYTFKKIHSGFYLPLNITDLTNIIYFL